VRVAGMQTETVFEQDAGIHAGQHSDVPLWTDGEFTQLEIARESFVGF